MFLKHFVEFILNGASLNIIRVLIIQILNLSDHAGAFTHQASFSLSICVCVYAAPGPSLWDTDLANQIVHVVNQRPRNGFEEMVQWTRAGKLWQYPINNEAGERGYGLHLWSFSM